MTVGKKAVVLLSGGLDSATVLALAKARGFVCHALSFHYGQRHDAELQAARRVAETLGADSHREMPIPIGSFGGSALTDSTIAVPENGGDGIPVTYVPARNTIFLSFALGLAEVLEADAIFIGVNAVDYSGYPDCRPEFVAAFQSVVDVATRATVEGAGMQIEAPLIDLSKGQIIKKGISLGVDYAMTVSCYQASSDGRACGACDACRLRREGFQQAGVDDPTRYA